MSSNSYYKNSYVRARIRNDNVTGTAIELLVSNGQSKSNYCVDKGLFLDPNEQDNNFTDEKYNNLDAVFLTHAHVDHCGQIPHICKNGFDGKIYMSRQTSQISQALILDEFFVLGQNGYEIGKDDERAYRKMINQTRIINNYENIKLDNLTAIFLDNAHVLGSNMLYLKTNKSRRNLNLLITGDYRPTHPFISTRSIRRFIKKHSVDVLFLEATYGSREKEEFEFDIEQMATKIIETIKRGGKVILPVFSFDRAQVILYCLAKIQRMHVELKNIPIYVDGKLMQLITNIYQQNSYLFKENINNIFPNNIVNVVGKAQRDSVIADKKSSIILATSGQMHSGSIVSYIQNMIDNPNNTLMTVGYIAHQMGKIIVNAEFGDEIMYAGKAVTVKCDRLSLSGFSAHADINELKDLVKTIKECNPELMVVLYHGDSESKANLKKILTQEKILDSSKIYIPTSKEYVNINKYTLSGSQQVITDITDM